MGVRINSPLMSRSVQAAQESVDNIKKHLKNYSRFLRRDFLAILVKMTAKELNIRTVRGDWRTRKGMLAFLQSSWGKFVNLVSADSIFNWYTHNFDSAEKFFTNRKLMMFIYANWSQYSSFLESRRTIDFIKIHQNELEEMASMGLDKTYEWSSSEIGAQMEHLIKRFRGALPANSLLKSTDESNDEDIVVVQEPKLNPVPLPQPEQAEQVVVPNESSVESQASTEAISSEYDDISVEDSLDIFPFEICSAYDTKDFLTISHIEDPFSIDYDTI